MKRILQNLGKVFILMFIISGMHQVKVLADDKIEEKIVYLTFDDGPGDKTTDGILDILKKEKVPATFFIVGKQIKGRENTLLRMVKEGHALGLHTYCHKYNQIYKSDEIFIDEMIKCQKEIYKVTNVKTNIIRFPGGSYKRLTPKLNEKLKKYNFKIFDWNMALSDGLNYKTPVNQLINEGTKTKRKLRRNIVLMHCDTVNKNTQIALPAIIKYYKDNGYKFKCIDENTQEYHFKIRK